MKFKADDGKTYKIKTIDVHGKMWFDKVNGNSYHSAKIVINFGMPNVKVLFAPFQYGYGDQYEESAGEVLGIDKMKMLWAVCKDEGVIYRRHIEHNCRKREVKAWGMPYNPDA